MTQQATCFQYCKILRCYLNSLFSGRNTPKLKCQMLTSVWKGIKIKNAYFVLNKNTYIWVFIRKMDEYCYMQSEQFYAIPAEISNGKLGMLSISLPTKCLSSSHN